MSKVLILDLLFIFFDIGGAFYTTTFQSTQQEQSDGAQASVTHEQRASYCFFMF